MAGREKIVIDASVVTKWYSEEEKTDKAVQYKNRHVKGEVEVTAPALLLYEVANALNYKPDFTEEDVKDAINALIDLSLSIEQPTKEIMEKTVFIARRYNISIYEASYIALAEILNVTLVTADEKLREKVKGHPLVLLLE
ncbi:MAG: twitching motility protein PilT [Candidatus Bathyarchaeota archaeon B26-2]|nr:MAG: twitching motility protein PilT [Candidatus Bathyarchaeota archaeon B26-2]